MRRRLEVRKASWRVRATLLAAAAALLTTAFPAVALAGVGTWTSGGPSGGWVKSIAISPNFAADHTAFAMCYGLYKSTDDGASWTELAVGAPGSPVGLGGPQCIAVSPNFAVDHTIFAGVWGSEGSILKSVNGGTTWIAVGAGLTPLRSVYAMGISPAFAVDRTIFAGTDAGMFRSTNGGASWTEINSGMDEGVSVWSIGVSGGFTTDRTVLAATNGVLFKSTNAGTSWSPIDLGFEYYCAGGLALSPDFRDDGTAFVVLVRWEGPDEISCLYRSTNWGDTWTEMTTTLPEDDMSSVAVSPAFASDQTVLAGGWRRGVSLSTDGGDNWSAASTGLKSGNVSALAPSPAFASDQTVLAGTMAGIFRTQDGAGSWTEANAGVAKMGVGVLAASPGFGSDSTLFAGTEAGLFRSADGASSWQLVGSDVVSSSVQAIAVSPAFGSDHTVFVGTWSDGAFKSTDGGGGWSPVNNGLYDAVNSLVISPNYPSDTTLFCVSASKGYSQGWIYRSTDGGGSWFPRGQWADDLAISPNFASDQTLFAIAGDDIVRTTNGGGDWDTVHSYSQGFNSIAVSPNYAADQTVVADWAMSTDGGTTWGSYAQMAPFSVAFSPDYASDSTMFGGLSSDYWGSGVFRRAAGEDSYREISGNIAGESVGCVAVSPAYATDRTLFAGTWPKGVYSLTIPSDTPTPTGTLALNGGAVYTRSIDIIVNSNVADAQWMRLSEDQAELPLHSWLAYQPAMAYQLWYGDAGYGIPDGTKTVYAQYQNWDGETLDASDTIVLDRSGPKTWAPYRSSVRRFRWATLRYKVTDALSPKATVRIKIKTLRGRLVKTLYLPGRLTNRWLSTRFKCGLRRGTYRFFVYAVDLAGNGQRRLGYNRLTVW